MFCLMSTNLMQELSLKILFLVVYFMFSKEGLHKVQDCSPQKKKEIRNMIAKRENRESRGIFLNLIDS